MPDAAVASGVFEDHRTRPARNAGREIVAAVNPNPRTRLATSGIPAAFATLPPAASLRAQDGPTVRGG